MTSQTVTRSVAEFVATSGADALPDDVVHAVRRAIVDFAGVALAGTRHESWHIAHDMVARLGTGGRCRIIGSEHRTDCLNAALINGIAAHVLDWDDTILPTRAHLSAALLPALLAEGELRGWTMRQVIHAFAIGFEIQSRLNHCIYPSVHLRGWQGTGIVGGIGTAAAAGRLMGLDADRLVHAMGIAATGAAGLIATFGSMSKALNIGRAGASGLQSAHLAALGFTSHDDILGSARFLDLFDDAPRRDLIADGLGSPNLGNDWAILRNGYKPYPCGFVSHAMIEAVRSLRARRGRSDGLRRLVLRVSPESTQLMGNRDPRNELEAKFSLVYEAAVAWIDGNVTPAAFEAATVQDRRYRGVMSVVEIVVSETIRQDEAFAEGAFEDGATQSVHVEHAKGTSIRPMTDADLLDKFTAALAMGGIADGRPLYDLIITMTDAPAAAILDHLAKAPAA